MNPRLKAALDYKQKLINEARAIEALAEPTQEQCDRFKAICGPGGELEAVAQTIEEAKSYSAALEMYDKALNNKGISPSAIAADISNIQIEKARANRYRGSIKNFTGTREEKCRKAFGFGMWMLAVSGKQQARDWCQQNGMSFAVDRSGGATFGGVFGQNGFQMATGNSEGLNEDGGYVVPPEYDDEMIILREEYGVFRRFANIRPMSSDVSSRPRRRSGLQAYFVGESAQAAEAKLGWDRVELIAQKAMVLAAMSTELSEDAIINMGDTLAGEIAYSFAYLEDLCGFIGDGTSTYGKMVGLTTKLLDIWGVGGGLGLHLCAGAVGSDTTYQNLALLDFNDVMGLLPQFADRPGTGWFCHKSFYHAVMQRLMFAAGGVTSAEIAAGQRTLIFMGYPVNITQVMPNSQAVSQVPVVFGNLNLSTDFGDRRKTTIMLSEHANFDTDEIAIRGTERFDIKNHDVGSPTDFGTVKAGAGPVVGLLTAAA